MNWQDELLEEYQKTQEPKKFVVSDLLRDRLAREFRGEVLYREPMSKHTSMRVGGAADVYLKPADLEDLKKIFVIAREEGAPILFHGSGSNTLVRDGGIRGFVITPPLSFQECQLLREDESTGDVEMGAGVKITRCVHFAKENSLSGMETLVGIPGTIGGAVMMNAGAHGMEIQDVLREIKILDKEGEVVTVSREKLEFDYRHLKLPRSSLILSAVFRLRKGELSEIEKKVEHYQKWRVEHQPLNFPNLGSIFKNPPSIPPLSKGGRGDLKRGSNLSAGQLIEETGLKNVRIGGARISSKHANFIVNENKATARDVLVLVNLIRDRVKESTGILLETEVRVVGED